MYGNYYEHRNWETHKQEEEGVFLLLELTDLTLTLRIWQSAMQNTLGCSKNGRPSETTGWSPILFFFSTFISYCFFFELSSLTPVPIIIILLFAFLLDDIATCCQSPQKQPSRSLTPWPTTNRVHSKFETKIQYNNNHNNNIITWHCQRKITTWRRNTALAITRPMSYAVRIS